MEFRRFLVAIDKAVPADLDVHLVCDNLATHKTPAIRDWLALIPLGALTGGLIAHLLGLRARYLIAGALRGIALFGALPVLIGALRARDTPPRASTQHSE